MVLLLGSDWRSGVLGRRQSLRQGCRRQALQEAVAGGRQRSFDTFRRNRDYPGLDGIITASVCPLGSSGIVPDKVGNITALVCPMENIK